MNDPISILLVEDNHMDVELTLEAFREALLNNPIRVVNDGQTALDYLFGRGEYEDREAHPLPGLILLDLKLRRVDGTEVLRQVKQTPGLKRIPMVVLTSSRERRDMALSYDLGANSYLAKPVAFREFLEVVRGIGDYWLTLNAAPPL